MKKVYLFDVDEVNGRGVFRISHVEVPAIEKNFISFSKEEDFKFNIEEEKMRLIGPIIIPNKEMYRKNLDGYIKFTEKSIENSRFSFKKNNNMFAVNVEHTEQEAPSFLLEDWIIEDPITDKANVKYNLGLEKGSWVGIMQITDKDYWEKMIKTEKVKGFSVEIDPSSVNIKENFNMEKKEIKKVVDETPEEVVETPKVELAEEVVVEAPAEEVVEEVVEEDTYMTKEEATKQFADIMSRLEKLELMVDEKTKEVADATEEVEQLRKELDETRANVPGSKSFVFNKEKTKKELTFSQKMKEKIFAKG